MIPKHLSEDWHNVVVVSAGNQHLFEHTYQAVCSRSLRKEASVLASDEPQVREVLDGLNIDADYVLPAELPETIFWAEVLRSCPPRLRENSALNFVVCGTDVPDCWDARLAASGQRLGGLSVVSPLGMRDPILGLIPDTEQACSFSVDELDQWLNEYSMGEEFSVPVLSTGCLHFPVALMQRVLAGTGGDDQLVENIRAAGAGPLATDHLCVDDLMLERSTNHLTLPSGYRDAFVDRSRLSGIRHAFTELAARGECPPKVVACAPVQLHVGHSWGGGLARWIEDYTQADDAHRQLVLKSIGEPGAFGQLIALYAAANADLPLRTWTMTEPILSVVHSSIEYRQMLEDLVTEFNVESIVLSSLIGHSLDILRTELPTTVVLHDFFPFCPALYATFGDPCQTCSRDDLKTCMKDNPKNSFFDQESSEHWWGIRAAFTEMLLDEKITLVAPSQSVLDRYGRLEPRLLHRRAHVIPHGLSDELGQPLRQVAQSYSAESSPKLKLVVLGRVSEEKGGDILAQVLDKISVVADIWLLGAGKNGVDFKGRRGVSVIPEYHREELADLLQEIQPDLGLLISTVPETFSYTLSELWAAAVPVVATRLGALEERITDGRNGWLVDPTAESVVARLNSLSARRDDISAVRANLCEQHILSTSDMVEAYGKVNRQPPGIPLSRYRLPRRTFVNPYRGAAGMAQNSALAIESQQPYRSVLAQFLRYSARKAEHSPRIAGFAGKLLAKMLGKLAQWSGGEK